MKIIFNSVVYQPLYRIQDISISARELVEMVEFCSYRHIIFGGVNQVRRTKKLNE